MVKGMGWGSVLVGWLAVSESVGMFYGPAYGFLTLGIGIIIWGLLTVVSN